MISKINGNSSNYTFSYFSENPQKIPEKGVGDKKSLSISN